jgi:hypothetical protein
MQQHPPDLIVPDRPVAKVSTKSVTAGRVTSLTFVTKLEYVGNILSYVGLGAIF